MVNSEISKIIDCYLDHTDHQLRNVDGLLVANSQYWDLVDQAEDTNTWSNWRKQSELPFAFQFTGLGGTFFIGIKKWFGIKNDKIGVVRIQEQYDILSHSDYTFVDYPESIEEWLCHSHLAIRILGKSLYVKA